jgi:serine/threonine-protein kinase
VNQAVGQLPAEVREGEIVGGKYRIENVIGAGAMGVVVAARHLLLEERVAIKFLLPHALDSRDAVARFMREARAAVKIKSEHVARVSDVSVLEDGTPYIVMEFLEGLDLADWLRQRGPLPTAQAVEFVLQACEAIAEAHSLGIVHRDLKPANLFAVQRVDGVSAIKVLDFGISKTTGSTPAGGSITDTTTVMGSPSYMSPEQMESSHNVDAQTDIWALGAILCELVTGKLPYEGHTLPQVYATIVAQPQPSLRALSPEVSEDLESVILKCLQRNRTVRYRNVGELAAALMLFAPKRAHASIDRIARVFNTTQPGSDPAHPASWPTAHTLTVQKTLASEGQPMLPAPRARHRTVRYAALLLALPAALTWAFHRSTSDAARPPPLPPDPGGAISSVSAGPPSESAPLAAATAEVLPPRAAEVDAATPATPAASHAAPPAWLEPVAAAPIVPPALVASSRSRAPHPPDAPSAPSAGVSRVAPSATVAAPSATAAAPSTSTAAAPDEPLQRFLGRRK